jgi:Holliday junction resolvase
MTPEGKVKAAVKKLLEISHVYFFMPSANGYGRAGISDFIACANGHFISIETKAGKGTTTALQDREIERVKAAGGTALIINERNLDDLEKEIKKWA